MDALEDLKKQAKHELQLQEQASDTNASLAAFQHSEVASALEQIHEYLNAFHEQLRIANPATRFSLDINRSGRIDNLLSGNYRLYTESTFDQSSVGFTFTLQCRKQQCRLSQLDEAARDRLKNKLRHLGLEISQHADGELEISGQIAASLVFRSNYARRLINLSINNIINSDLQTFEIDPDTIDKEFLNHLGNYLLHRENRLIETIREQEKSATFVQEGPGDTDEPEPTLTEMMESSLVNNLFKDRQQLYLTYHERIRELTSRDSSISLGRSSKCDFVIESDCASRQHALLVYRRGKFILTDDSTNGTFIKPQGGREVYIHHEDYPLSGSGFISLGESISVDNEHLIYYSCQ